MGTYSVLLIDGPLTVDQQSVLRQMAEEDAGRLDSNWDRLRRLGVSEDLLAEDDRSFWALDTGRNFGARHWAYLRRAFVDPIRTMLPATRVYLTTDYLLDEHEWTRAQWLEIAEGRRDGIHSSWVEQLTDAAIAGWEAAAGLESSTRAGAAVRGGS